MRNSPKSSALGPPFRAAGAPGGAVLDIACGGGRHLRLFAEAGHPVTGIDRDLGGVADLPADPASILSRPTLRTAVPGRCRRNGGSPPSSSPTICTGRCCPSWPDLLNPGGVLIYETFARGNERFGRPSSPAFLLDPGELLEVAARGLQVVAFEQGEIEIPKKAVVQRLCAVSAEYPHPLAWPLPS